MFLSELPGYWFVVDRKSPYCKTGVTDFGDKGMTWYRNFQGWGLWEWRFTSIVEGWVYSLDDFSWTYRWHYDELATLTQNQSEGMMNHRCEWTVKMITQSKQSRTWSERSVMFKSDLLPKRNFTYFPKIIPGHFSTSTSLFFNKLEEDNICLIYNSTLRVNKEWSIAI